MSYKRYTINPPGLQRARAIMGMSAVNVAGYAGIPYERYMSYETGRAEHMERPLVEILADILDTHPSAFITDYEDPEPTVTRVAPRVDMIRDYLRDHGLTANQFAAKCGVASGVIYGFVNRGRMQCKASTAWKIAVNGLEVEPRAFCEAFRYYQPVAD